MKLLVTNKRHNIQLLIISLLILFGCSTKSQSKIYLDEVLQDTTKWPGTDTINFDFNEDKLEDLMIRYGKYYHLSRPGEILAPLVFYLNKGNNHFQLLHQAGGLISLPQAEFEKVSDKRFILK